MFRQPSVTVIRAIPRKQKERKQVIMKQYWSEIVTVGLLYTEQNHQEIIVEVNYVNLQNTKSICSRQ